MDDIDQYQGTRKYHSTMCKIPGKYIIRTSLLISHSSAKGDITEMDQYLLGDKPILDRATTHITMNRILLPFTVACRDPFN